MSVDTASTVGHPSPVVAQDDRFPITPASATAFLAVGGALVLVAIDGGGYDIVVRQRAAVLLWWVLAVALLAGQLPKRRPALAGSIVLGALLSFGIWTAASFGWTSSDERTLTEVARVSTHLGVVLLLATSLGPRTWRPALAGAVTAAVAICGVALGGRLSPGLFGTDYVSQAFGTARRLQQPLGYWNAVGAWAGMTGLLCLGWSAHTRRPLLRGAMLAAVPLATAVVYLTYSRAALLGVGVGVIVLVAASRNRWTLLAHCAGGGVAGTLTVLAIRSAPEIADGTGSAGALRVLGVLVATAIALVVLAVLVNRSLDRIRMSSHSARNAFVLGTAIVVAAGAITAVTIAPDAWDSFRQPAPMIGTGDPAARLTNLNGTRDQIWDAALHQFGEHPFNGVGAGTFEFSWNLHGSEGEFIRNGHSLYLETMASLGLPGLLLILLFVGAAAAVLAGGIRTIGDPGPLIAVAGATAAYFLGAGVDWLWESTAVSVLVLVLVGCAIAATSRTAPPLRLPARLPLAIVALVFCAIQLPGLVSTSEIRRSQTAVDRGDIPAAIDHADDAIAAQPWAASPLIQRALIEEQSDRLAAARTDLASALRREPLNWRIPLVLARVEARQGHVRAALAAYDHARALRPRAAFFDTT